MELIEVASFAEVGARAVDDPQPDGAAHAFSSHPDACWTVRQNSQVQARCALWWATPLTLDGHRVGVIGDYAAADDVAAERLLQHACSELSDQGCTLAVGPMDGNTWGHYRFVTHFRTRPPFWMEPINPPQWPLQFVQSGFAPLAHYFSSLCTRLDQWDQRLDHVARRMDQLGVCLRPLVAARLEEELRNIYQVVRVAFGHNLLYTDVGERTFLDQTRGLQRTVPLELTWLAEHEGRTVGFLFAFPDFCELQRSTRERTVVVKTLGVLPARRYAGLGQLLLACFQRRAHELGYTQAIHALVRETAALRRISLRYAHPMRRYTLFAKALT